MLSIRLVLCMLCSMMMIYGVHVWMQSDLSNTHGHAACLLAGYPWALRLGLHLARCVNRLDHFQEPVVGLKVSAWHLGSTEVEMRHAYQRFSFRTDLIQRMFEVQRSCDIIRSSLASLRAINVDDVSRDGQQSCLAKSYLSSSYALFHWISYVCLSPFKT